MAVTPEFINDVAEALDELGYSIENQTEQDVIDDVSQLDDDVTLPGVKKQNGSFVGYVSMQLSVLVAYLQGRFNTVKAVWDVWFGTAPSDQSEGSGVQKAWADLSADAVAKTNAANSAAAAANNAAASATAATAGAENVNATLNVQNGIVVLTVTNRNGSLTSREVSFYIAKTYATVSAMNADAANISEGKFVMIAGSVEEVDTGKLYVRNGNAAASGNPFTFLTDLSGAQGMKGDTPVITADVYGTLYADGVKLTDIIKDTIGDVNDWFSDTSATGVRKLWNDFWTNVNTAWNGFFGASASDTNGVRYIWSNWYSGVQSTFTSWFGVDDTTAGGVQKAWKDISMQASADHSQASDDHARAESDHSTASGDHSTAGDDHTRAGSDHSVAAGDHDQYGIDHGRASDDHTRAESDHDTAEDDHAASAAATGLAAELGAHPPYIADGTQAKPGDLNYWYIWSHSAQEYVKDAYARGSDLDYGSMTEQEKQDLANRTSDVSYDSQTRCLTKTKNGVTTDIVELVTSGFSLTENDALGIDELAPIGSATITEDNTNGYDEFDF